MRDAAQLFNSRFTMSDEALSRHCGSRLNGTAVLVSS